MAIYHMNVGFVSRSTGRSSVQSAAYITGEKLHESRRDLTANFQNRSSDVAFTETLAPELAPVKFKELSVWDQLESFEDEYAYARFPHNQEARDKYINSARTAQTVVVALPKELSMEVSKELVEEFVKTRFVSRGLIVTYACHDDAGNPHAHLQISRRSVNEKGELSWAKDRDICTRKSLMETRKLWADLTNQYLAREGYQTRITEKSFADLGIHLEPTNHRGWVSDKLAEMGVPSRIMIENEQVFERNREALLEDPSRILPELTQNSATFSQLDILKAAQKRVGDDSKLVAIVFEGALNSSIPVGSGMDGMVRYTSLEYQALEKAALDSLAKLDSLGYGVKGHELTSLFATRTAESLKNSNVYDFSVEQREAIIGLTGESQFACLVGRAGAGKTTALLPVTEAYKNSGYQVIGTSLSAMAAENLGKETAITSKTLHSWLYQWNRYEEAQTKFLSFNSVMTEGMLKQLDWYKDLKQFEGAQLTDKHVVIVDEAGMIGTRQWSDLLRHIEKAGAKLIAVGDDHQFKAIEAGDFFREMKNQAQEKGALYSLGTIVRQRQMWMREASHQFAELNVNEALSLYEGKGCVFGMARGELHRAIAREFVDKIEQGQQGLVLAFSNAETRALNVSIREQLKEAKLIGQEDIVSLNAQSFASKDQVIFLENDKKILTVTDANGQVVKDAFIKNGTRGVIQSVDKKGRIHISLGDNRFTALTPVKGDLEKAGDKLVQSPMTYDYTKIASAYAVTTHKSQGQTVDFTLVAASKYMDAMGIYVAMTRHLQDVKLFYNTDEFKSYKALATQLSRFQHKDLVKDYTIRPHQEAAWQRVQEYRLTTLDAAVAAKDKDWESYHQIKRDQVQIGKEILKDYGSHQLFVNQAGLTKEMMSITIGAKDRPLSHQEAKAKETVLTYGQTAQRAREAWHTIRSTHPGPQAKSHSLYNGFKELQQKRDGLATQILNSYPLHREFVNGISRAYGINHKTITAQAARINNKNIPGQGVGSTLDRTLAHTRAPYLSTKEPSLDPAFVRGELNTKIKDIAHQLLGKPTSARATEWRYGNKGSISVHVSGHKQGLYSNFETGEAGNALKLIQDHLGCDSKEAYKWGVQWLGHGHSLDSLSKAPAVRTTMPAVVFEKREWTALYPAPSQSLDLKAEKQLFFMLRGRQETARFAYHDAEGQLLGYVVRLEDKAGDKITPTLTFCVNDKGQKEWRWQGFGNDRPLYGLDQLKLKPKSSVLVVEGEKTAEAAKKLFPDHAVITWSGGCGAVQKTDWSPLKGREVIIWPDNDKAGITAASKIEKILMDQGLEKVKTVALPSTLAHKWDLADKLPEDLSLKGLRELLPTTKVAKKVVEKPPVVIAPLSKKTFDEVIDRFKLVSLFTKPNEDNFKVATEVFKALQSCAPPNQNTEHLKERSVFIAMRMNEMGNNYALEKPEALSRLLLESKLWQSISHNGNSVNMSFVLHSTLGTLKKIEEKHKPSRGKSLEKIEVKKFMECAFDTQKNIASLEKSSATLQALTKIVHEQRDIHRQLNLEREMVNQLGLER
jgi:nucleoside-triphosphatase THEP1/5S rRNA maturation endonuclease (ribonuclease M5)